MIAQIDPVHERDKETESGEGNESKEPMSDGSARHLQATRILA